MNPIHKTSLAVLLAGALALPAGAALAATTHAGATMMMGAKSDAAPVGTLTPMIGNFQPADLSALDSASSIRVIDAKQVYSSADQSKIASAQKAANLGRLHDAINRDATLKNWFAANKIDVNRVIGVNVSNGADQVYLF